MLIQSEPHEVLTFVKVLCAVFSIVSFDNSSYVEDAPRKRLAKTRIDVAGLPEGPAGCFLAHENAKKS